MKKTSSLLLLLVLVALSLCSCSSHSLALEVNDENRFTLDTKLDTPILQTEYTDGGSNVSIYYLGRVNNVPLAYSEPVEHKKMTFVALEFDESDFNEAIFTTAKNNAISEIVSNDIPSTAVLTDATGKKTTVNLISQPTVDYRYSIQAVLNVGNTPNIGYSFIDSYAYSSAFVDSKRVDLQGKIGMIEKECYGRISLVGSCDVYAFAAYNEKSNTISISYDLSVVNNSLSFGTDISADGEFRAKAEHAKKLMMNVSVLEGSSVLDNISEYSVTYVLNGGEFAQTPKNTYTLANTDLSVPSLSYFDFGGWYFDSTLTDPVTPEAMRQRSADITVYAKWNTQTDESHFEGYTGLTSNIKGQEVGRVNTVAVDQNKLQAYIEAGYRAKVTYYYTYGVPTEYEGTSDSSDLTVEIGLSDDTYANNFILLAKNNHDAVAPGYTGSSSVSFEIDLSYLMQYLVTARTVILSNDTAVLGICGKDAGTYSYLKMVIEYVK